MSEAINKILDDALTGDAASVVDLVRQELSGRARAIVQAKSEEPIENKTATKEAE